MSILLLVALFAPLSQAADHPAEVAKHLLEVAESKSHKLAHKNLPNSLHRRAPGHTASAALRSTLSSASS